MRTRAYLSLGSNLGDRVAYLTEAVRRLETAQTHIERVSSLYETAPQGLTDQPYFLNMVVAVKTEQDPFELLQVILATEQALGRVRNLRWGPRIIDIDLLLFGEMTVTAPELQLPHPRLAERAFVLIPLLELEPELALPPDGLSQSPQLLRNALDTLSDQGVALYLESNSFLKRIRGVQ